MKATRDEKPEHFAVTVTCDTCKQGRDVDLDALIAAKGENFSLVNKRYRCKFSPGCPGHNRFHFQGGVMRPLWSETQADKWIAADYLVRTRLQAAQKYVAASLRGEIVRHDPAPPGVDQNAWAIADDRERKRLIRKARD